MVVSLDPLRLDLFLKCSGSSKAFGVEGLKALVVSLRVQGFSP